MVVRAPTVGVSYTPKSLLAFVLAISMLALFVAIVIGNEELKTVALVIFVGFFLMYFIFLLPGLSRAIRRI